MIPLYIQLVRIHWINTYRGDHSADAGDELWYLSDAPACRVGDTEDELMEAARVDGAGEWWIFRRVLVPLSGNALSAVGILAFIQGLDGIHLASAGGEQPASVQHGGGADGVPI